MGAVNGSVGVRFWRYVLRTVPDSNCWLWLASVDGSGYGCLKDEKGKLIKSHRFSYELHKGPIEKGLHVLHTCNNPRCVNPEHLYVGTNFDNILDKVAHGRQAKGEAIKTGKLTTEQVYAIRAAEGTHREIAKQFGIAHQNVGEIKRGRAWRHLP